jgi:hypothetical protein
MRDVRNAAERGMEITERNGGNNCLRYEKQMRELKQLPKSGKQLKEASKAM